MYYPGTSKNILNSISGIPEQLQIFHESHFHFFPVNAVFHTKTPLRYQLDATKQ